MAYNTKYILRYCSRFGDSLRIELQIDGYIGQAFLIVNNGDNVSDDQGRNVAVNIDGNFNPDRDMNLIEGTDNPFTLQFRNDTGEKGGSVRATSASMAFFEDAVFNIDDLATSDEMGIRCKFFVNDELEWIGFVTPDFFNVEITSNPVINLTASDRIGILKDIPYPLDDFYKSQRKSKLAILIECLKKTGLELPINICCRLYCEEFDHGYESVPGFEQIELTNYLQDSFVSELRFVTDAENEETLDCYSIITKMGAEGNCFVTQYKGEWWVINKSDLEHGLSILHRYNFNSTRKVAVSKINFGEQYFNHIDTGGQRTLIPAGAKNTYELNHGENVIYPTNPRLRSNGQYLNTAPSWSSRQPIGVDWFDTVLPTLYNPSGTYSDFYNTEYKSLRIRSSFIENLSNDTTNFLAVPPTVPANSWIIQSEEFKIVTVNGKKSVFKFSAEVINKPQTAIMIGVFMKIRNRNTNEYWYFRIRRYNNTGSGRALDFTNEYWFERITDINTTDSVAIVPIYQSGNANNINIAQSYKHEFDMSIAAGQNQSELDLNDAYMFIRIYPNVAYRKWADGSRSPEYNSSLTNVDSKVLGVSINFSSDDQTPKSTVFQTLLDANYTKPTEPREVLFGDYQTFGQNGYFYQYREDSLSIQYNKEGRQLKNWWTPYDSERNPMLIHSLRQFTKSYGKSHDELSISFDISHISPLSQYAIRCYSERKVDVQKNEMLKVNNDLDVSIRIGRYLNDKKFTIVEGEFDYLRSKFTGKMAQTVLTEQDDTEYIFSKFDNNTN